MNKPFLPSHLLFFSAIIFSCSTPVQRADNGLIQIQNQGSFAVGGTVITNPADSYYMTDSDFKLATAAKEKELFLIPGATHIQTYYVPEYVSQAMDKLRMFFSKNL